uniref:NADH dehydrogenase subunit 6 n=1 Tax=Hyalella tiwanaku TaxID=2759786 RepID=A0A7T8V755_9CRUS|nr:NADH dehydrogenase subunit 6 [Hyalella tiwanaku]
MLLISLSISVVLACMFTQVSSPLGLAVIVVMFSLFISMNMSLICSTSWFSLLLFMLFLSGMMIIFIYVCSLASNETHFYSFSVIYLVLIFMVLIMFSPVINSLMTVGSDLLSKTDTCILMHKVYSFSVYLFTLALIIYLLITLIVAVKICMVSDGPVRTKK